MRFNNAIRAVLTWGAVAVVDVLVLRSMGWTSLDEISLVFAWSAVATFLLLQVTERHWRRDLFSRAVLALTLAGWVLCGMLWLSTEWPPRWILAAVILLPGALFLLLERLGVTPVSNAPGQLP